MTDYLYSLSLARQTGNFLLSLGFGFIMGAVYDVFRIIRMCISKGKAAFVICDILYSTVLCFCVFLFCLTVNEGEIRGYLILGGCIGFAAYYFSLGAAVYSLSEKTVAFIKSFFGKLFKVIFFPIGKLFRFFKRKIKKSHKKVQKVKNKSKFLLKVDRQLLYNLRVKKAKSGSFEKKDV